MLSTCLTKYMIAHSRDVHPNSDSFRDELSNCTMYRRRDADECLAFQPSTRWASPPLRTSSTDLDTKWFTCHRLYCTCLIS